MIDGIDITKIGLHDLRSRIVRNILSLLNALTKQIALRLLFPKMPRSFQGPSVKTWTRSVSLSHTKYVFGPDSL